MSDGVCPASQGPFNFDKKMVKSVLKIKDGKYLTVRRRKQDVFELIAKDSQQALDMYAEKRQKCGEIQFAFCIQNNNSFYYLKVKNPSNFGLCLDCKADQQSPLIDDAYWFKFVYNGGEYRLLEPVAKSETYISVETDSSLVLTTSKPDGANVKLE